MNDLKENYREPRRFRWHWQNLYKEDHPTAKLSAIRDGRGWLRFGRAVLGMQWVVFGRPTFGISIATGDEEQLSGFIQLVFFSFYWSLEGIKLLDKIIDERSTREVSVRVHDAALWWTIWSNPNVWHNTDPKWRDGCFHFDDFLLGKNDYSIREEPPVNVIISMPEGDYPATVTLSEQVWKRPRWPIARKRKGANVDIKAPGGVPIPGKGEMSYNCGEDGFTSIGTSATTIDGAVLAAIDSVNKRRLRYGGPDWRPGRGEL